LPTKLDLNGLARRWLQHQERKYGLTKFGLERFINGFLDLFTVIFVSRFGKKPMHLFGTLGTLMFLLGGSITMWLVGSKLYAQFNHLSYRAVTDQPLFYIALVMAIVGMQLFMTGFLGELISRSSADRNHYLIDKSI
jgi:ATP/ADP translocase